jgi:hypothetical protein
MSGPKAPTSPAAARCRCNGLHSAAGLSIPPPFLPLILPQLCCAPSLIRSRYQARRPPKLKFSLIAPAAFHFI